MKKSNRLFSTFIALILVLCVSTGNALAYVEYSLVTTIDELGNYKFKIYSSIYLDGDSLYRGGAWIEEINLISLPAGALGASAMLCDNTGATIASTEMTYTTSSIYFAFSVTRTRSYPTPVYATGTVCVVYNGQEMRYDTQKTETYGRSALVASLAENLDKDGNYPVNAAGESYGSALLSDVVGVKPDLITAVGEDGVRGYIRSDDIYPHLTSLEEIMLYKDIQDEIASVPLYDLNGNVIGVFPLDKPNDEDLPDECLDRLNELKHAVENPVKKVMSAEEQDKYLRELHKDELVAGDYPRNANGESYGTDGLAAVLGHHPDLMSAVGEGGIHGYIRRSDLIPTFKTASERQYYIQNVQGKRRMIPLYDCEGNVIGEFRIN